MPASIDRPLKVLTRKHCSNVANFNQACRDLQAQQIRLRCMDLMNNRVEIDPENGRRLVTQRLVLGLTHRETAGSTFYTAQFQGVTLQWREPISHTRPAEYAGLTTH